MLVCLACHRYRFGRMLRSPAPCIALLLSVTATVGCSSGSGSRLGRSCENACPSGGICASVESGCDANQLCITRDGQRAGYCTTPCTSDTDCNGGGLTAAYLCSKSCDVNGNLANQCMLAADATAFNCRPPPPSSCANATEDGVCDDRSGLCPDGTDVRDCAGPDEPTMRCATLCPRIRASACPNDDLAECEARCVSMIDAAKRCRAQAYAWMECDATTENLCTGEGRTDMTMRPCQPEQDAHRTCASTP